MKITLTTLSILLGIVYAQALTISEIMSNPVGDDAGREWVEIYNNDTVAVDLSSLSISIKGGAPVGVVLLQGDSNLLPNSYAIVSSIVSVSFPTSKFLDPNLGYPSYTGILMRSVSSISLVNTGTTSLDIRLQGTIVDSISAYTPASEGKTLSRITGSFVTSTPTPGAENQGVQDTQSQITNTNTQASNQTTVIPMASPSPDIVLYLPKELLVVAGAETNFSVYGMTRSGKTIENLKAKWAFGDGGEGTGSTTTYTYAYPGRYVISVEAGDSYVMGVGVIHVTVVPPEITIASFNVGKYGTYIDIDNPNMYDLDLSQWKLHVDNAIFSFPKNTVVSKQSVTHISGRAMGFASTTPTDGKVIRITFPSQEEVTRFVYMKATSTTVLIHASTTIALAPKMYTKSNVVRQVNFITPPATSTIVSKQTKDTRLISWFRGLFGKQIGN